MVHVSRLEEHLHMIDVEASGIRSFIASYVLKGKRVALVETGPTSAVPNILLGLEQIGVRPEEVAFVAVSHIHLDHGGGAGTLLRQLPNARVVVHPRGAPHLADPEKLWQQSQQVLGRITDLYGKPEPIPEDRIVPATDGASLDLGKGVNLRVIETLGHASHHQSYFEPLGRGLFPGDAAGIYLKDLDVIVPTTPRPFRLDIALESLERLLKLEPKTIYYSHFGRASNAFEKVRSYAEQMKFWARAAKHGIENHETFDVIRQRIFKTDPAARKAEEYIKAHPILSDTTLQESIQGFVDFAEKHQLPP